MRNAWIKVKRGATRFWVGLRDWCGDSDYERYVRSALRSGSKKTLTPGQFYVEQLNRKYSRPNRCC